jgi:hypothetical protein
MVFGFMFLLFVVAVDDESVLPVLVEAEVIVVKVDICPRISPLGFYCV